MPLQKRVVYLPFSIFSPNLVHINNDHIHGGEIVEFKAGGSTVREWRNLPKAQYMLVVHMRRHIGGEASQMQFVSPGVGEGGKHLRVAFAPRSFLLLQDL